MLRVAIATFSSAGGTLKETVRPLVLSGLIVVSLATPGWAAPVQFRVKFTTALSAAPVTGRVVLLLDTNLMAEPREGAGPGNIFSLQPFYSVDVKDWKPDTLLVIDDRATFFLYRPSELPPRRYIIQAVLDTDTTTWSFANAPGNGYSEARIASIDASRATSVDLTIDHRVEAPRFEETRFNKEVDLESRLLSNFYRRPVRMKAAVILPPSYFDTTARYPVVYDIPGWGGTHYNVASNSRRYRKNPDGLDRILVILNPDAPLGHHTFADSANNGPRATALVKELIPYIEGQYRVIAEPAARLLVGQSSGAWAALWLQVGYPEFFGGAWVTAPDPVDFRSFVGDTDIYQPNANVFFDADGRPRTQAISGSQELLTVKEFSDMERVVGDGEQLGAWESVFSRRAADGKPERLFDRTTGRVDPAVAQSWNNYDLRLILEAGWDALGPRLIGKLHIYVGTKDTFLLDRPARLLADFLARRKSDAVVEFVDGHHFTVADNAVLRARVNDDMDATLKRTYPNMGTPR